MSDWYVLGAFVGYLALMLGIGFFFSKRQEDLGDYYLGGRRMNKWVVALSAQASDMSGWLLMGLPGAIYVGGFSEAWIGIGLLIGTYLNWKIVAHRLRVYSHSCNDSITIPDFICNRFRDRTGISRIVAAIIILVFFTFYTASGFVSCAKLFTTTFGIPETVTISQKVENAEQAKLIDAACDKMKLNVSALKENPVARRDAAKEMSLALMGVKGQETLCQELQSYAEKDVSFERFEDLKSRFSALSSFRITGYLICLIVGALVVVSYTLLGGYMAVCWTDFIQGSLMFVAIVLVPAIVVCNAGGFASTVDALNEINPYLQSLFTTASSGKAYGFIGLASCMAWGLGYFGMPHILVRFMSIDSPAEIKGSRRIAMSWVTISLAAATVIGLVFHLYLKQHGLTLAQVGDDPEKCFMIMINGIFHDGVIVRIFAGILLSAIMAAIMSTADSQLLVSASSFSNDLYKVVFRKKASNKELIVVSRLAVGVVAIVAIMMAMNTESDFFKVVMDMVSFAWGGFGAAFGPLILLALFWKRVNLAGAVSGMVVGAGTCFFWKFSAFAKAARAASPDSIFNLYELAPGFLFAFVVTAVVSLVTSKPSKDILDEFDGVNGTLKMDGYLAKLRGKLEDVLMDGVVSRDEAESIQRVLSEMPKDKE